MKRIPRVVFGFGSVGRAVAQLIEDNEGYESEGVKLELDSVFDRGGGVGVRGVPVERLLEAKARTGTVTAASDSRAVELDLALEQCPGGVLVDASVTDAATGEPGFSAAERALRRGLSVVFASKGPLVARYRELSALKEEFSGELGASAAVGIPLPVLDVGISGLRGAGLRRARGVLNDTANQILRDLEAGRTVDEAIAAARKAGIIEEDESLDIDGWDAAYKLLILARMFWNETLELGDVRTTGIRGLGRPELDEAKAMGERIRLVATGELREDGVVGLSVAPERLDAEDPLFSLRAGEKGFVFETEHMGRVTIKTEKGGPRTTAACVLKDVLNIALRSVR